MQDNNFMMKVKNVIKRTFGSNTKWITQEYKEFFSYSTKYMIQGNRYNLFRFIKHLSFFCVIETIIFNENELISC